MGLVTLEGVYKNGRVLLTEHPDLPGKTARVLVTFLPTNELVVGPPADDSEDRETLRQKAFARMKTGIHLGGPPYPRREELYDRFDG
jgi:hypothetical protein